MRRMQGHITVFISLIMMCMMSLLCVTVESARTAGARWYLQMASASALDSVFSQYHRELWERYRLFFVEYWSEDAIAADFSSFLKPYLETENWYPIEPEQILVTNCLRATDGDGMYMEQEVLDYMKYGVWKLDFDGDEITSLWDVVKEAGAVTKVAEQYRGHTKEALKLEQALEAISGNLSRQQEWKQEGSSQLSAYDGGGFRKSAQKLLKEAEKIPELVKAYQKRADQLAKGLEESRVKYDSEQTACSEEIRRALEEEISAYESYVSAEGERRKEIEALEAAADELKKRVEALIEESFEVEEAIDAWEAEEDEEEGSSEPDYDALWSPVQEGWSEIPIKALQCTHGVKDKEKEGWLKQVETLYQEGVLTLVLPENTELSEKWISLEELPSEQYLHSEDAANNTSREIGFLDHILVNEYCGDFFSNFLTAQNDDAGNPAEGRTKSEDDEESTEQALDYEVEYLLSGEESDMKNLAKTVEKLVAIREGLNLVHILSDATKRAQARELAMVITGAVGLAPLASVVSFFIMSVWALGESFLDVRGLLEGKKVELLKSKTNWQLDLDGLLKLGQERAVGEGGSESGFAYLSWLKILLFVEIITTQEYRMMDLIQSNLCLKQKNFQMSNGVFRVDIQGRFCGKHIFFSPNFVEKLIGETQHTYEMQTKVERTY